VSTLAKDSTKESLATEQWSFQGWKTLSPTTSFAAIACLQKQTQQPTN
jgi:hypothetical protein